MFYSWMRNKAFLEKKNPCWHLFLAMILKIIQIIITFAIHLKKHVILEAIMFQSQEIHLARVAQQNVFKMLATH